MVAHTRFVWKLMMPKCPAQHLALVAHSAGGMCVDYLWSDFRAELKAKLKALVFTDSGFHSIYRDITRQEHRLLKRIGIHYRAYRSDHVEVGEEFKGQVGPIKEVSAGTSEHVLTTGVSTPSLLTFIAKQFEL